MVSSRLPERAVVKGIDKTTAIYLINVYVALIYEPKIMCFTFSRDWKNPQPTFHFTSGPLALLNLTPLVSDKDLACENLLVGQPVLQHFGIGSWTMPEQQRECLHEVSLEDFDYS